MGDVVFLSNSNLMRKRTAANFIGPLWVLSHTTTPLPFDSDQKNLTKGILCIPSVSSNFFLCVLQ